MKMNKYKTIFMALILILMALPGIGQKYYTRSGEVYFTSQTPLEKIEAVSNTASSVLDKESGKLQWAVLIKSFEFEKALMQEHFNENYMESSKYPKAIFSGEVENIEILNTAKDQTVTLNISGEIEIHGQKRPMKTTAEFQVTNNTLKASSIFTVKIADFDIDVPAIVRDNIAKEIEINVKANYEILEN